MSQSTAPWIRAALLFVLAAGLANAQHASVSGTVTDADTGEPIPGAHVLVVEADMGTISGLDGSFSIGDIPVRTQTYRVRASLVGYTTLTRQVVLSEAGQHEILDFPLQAGIELETVVVEGYRVRRVPIESGAISTVLGTELEGLTVRAPDAALQGRASGVRVTSRSGQPGAGVSIQVRGSGSINAGTDPLFIVDGVQVNRVDQLAVYAFGNPLNAISPEDIESIEILKDAAAASIYGAQAANGVVIITTRRGHAGSTEVTFESQVGNSGQISDFRVQTAEEYVNYRVRAFMNRERVRLLQDYDDWVPGAPTFEERLEVAHNSYGDPDTMGVGTNWQDLVFRRGLTQSYNLSFRGGDQRTRFFASGRFVQDQGQVISSAFRQFAGRINLDHQVTDWLNLDARIGLSSSRYRGTISDGAWINSPFFAAQFLAPTVEAWVVPGDPSSGYNFELPSPFTFHPVAQEELDILRSNVVALIASGAMNIEILPNLFSRTFFGIQFDDADEFEYRDPRQPVHQGIGGSGRTHHSRTADYNVSQTLSYSHQFRDIHRLSAMAGTEYKRGTDAYARAIAQQFPFHLFNALSTAGEMFNIEEWSTEFRQVSLFGDAEYTYDNTYQLRGVVRYDGSSRFGEDRRFGLFGTVAGYVRPFRTGFIPELGFFDEFRLRGSYGVTGNSLIGNFASRRLFAGAGDYDQMPGIRPSALGNAQLTWESSVEANVGVDMAFLSNRVRTSVNVYRQHRDDLLLQRNIPNDSGFTSLWENVGTVRSDGLEFDLNTVNLDMGRFRWTSNFNITFQRMEVVSLLEGHDELAVGAIVYRVGEAPRQYRMLNYAGVNPATGRMMYWTRDGDLTYFPTDDDRILAGSPDPDFFGGFGNTFAYGGLSLDVFFQFDFGRQTFHNDRWFSDRTDFDYNKASRMNEYWQQPGDMAGNPIPWSSSTFFDGSTQGDAVFLSTRFMEDASYIRLKQLRLSYSLPQTVIGRTGMRTATVFVQGENLLTWTAFTGIDPEVVGTAIGRYPQARTLTTGVRIGI